MVKVTHHPARARRTSKTVNGVKHNYYYVDGQLRYERNGDSYEIYYTYDADGRPILATKRDLVAKKNYQYYLITNTRGDVIETRNGDGNVNAKFVYDAWGKLIAVTNASGTPLSQNSFAYQISLKYRGYVYDRETGLYYLQSRYYDPETGRFLNADDVDYIGYSGEQLSYNAFAYCENNPVNGVDYRGYYYLAFSLYNGYDDENGYAFLFTALNSSEIFDFKVTENANFAVLRVYTNNVKITICLSNSVDENKKYLLGFAKYDWLALLASQVFDVYKRVYKRSFYEKRSYKGVVLEIALHMYMYYFDIDKEYNYRSSKDIDIDTNGNGKYFEYKTILKQADKLTDLCLKAIQKGKKNLFVNAALKAYVKWSNRNK